MYGNIAHVTQAELADAIVATIRALQADDEFRWTPVEELIADLLGDDPSAGALDKLRRALFRLASQASIEVATFRRRPDDRRLGTPLGTGVGYVALATPDSGGLRPRTIEYGVRLART